MPSAAEPAAGQAGNGMNMRRVARAVIFAVVFYCVLIPLLVAATVITYSAAGVLVGAALATFTPHGGANE